MEPDEAGPGQHGHRPQAILVLLVQDDLFGAAGADRLYQASSDPERRGQRRRYAREGGGDQHRVERCLIRDSFGSVAHYDDDIADTRRGQVVPCSRGQIRPDLDADYPGGEPGQQRGLIAIARADLENPLGAGQPEGGDHRGRQRGLGGHLIVRDRHWHIIVGPVGVGAGHEVRPGRPPHRIQHTRIRYAGCFSGHGQLPRAGLGAMPGHELPPAMPLRIHPSHRRSGGSASPADVRSSFPGRNRRWRDRG